MAISDTGVMPFFDDTYDHFRTQVYGFDPRGRAADWSDVTAILLSSSLEKFEENDELLLDAKIGHRFLSMDAFVREAHEYDETPVEIVLEKLDVAGAVVREVSGREEEAFSKKIGVPSKEFLMQYAEDRSFMFSPLVLEHEIFQEMKADLEKKNAEYQKVHNCPDDAIQALLQAFDSNVDGFPGHRVKELMQHMGGLGPVLDNVFRAYRELPLRDPERYKELQLDDNGCIDGAKAVIACAVEWPKSVFGQEGLRTIVQVELSGFKVRSLTPEEAKNERDKSVTLDINDVAIPPGYDGSVTELKKDPDNDYFGTRSQFSEAWRVLRNLANIPSRDHLPDYSPIRIKKPVIGFAGNEERIVSAVSHRLEGAEFEDLELTDLSASTEPKDRKLFNYGAAKIRPDAVVLLPHKNVEGDLDQALAITSALEVGFDAITRRCVYDSQINGCPILISEREASGYNLAGIFRHIVTCGYQGKFSGLKPEEIFTVFSNNDELVKKLQWDPRWYEGPAHDEEDSVQYFNDARLEKITGISDWGYVIAGLGTATSTHMWTRDTGYRLGHLCTQAGVTLTTGGGTHPFAFMGATLDGGVKGGLFTANPGHQLNFTWATVAVKEGTHDSIDKDFGVPITQGDPDNGYVSYADRFHYLHLGENAYDVRKHGIMAPAHTGVFAPGGVGTYDELFKMVRHNLEVVKYGVGHLRGFESKNRKKNLLCVDLPVEHGRNAGYWSSVLSKVYNETQMDLARIQMVPTVDAAVAIAVHDAKRRDYPVSPIRYRF